MLYLSSEIELQGIEYEYKSYTADMLRGLMNALGGKVNTRFVDLISDDKKQQVSDTRTGEEIVYDVIKKLNLEVVE